MLLDGEGREAENRVAVLQRLATQFGLPATVLRPSAALLRGGENLKDPRWARQGLGDGCNAGRWHPGVGLHDLTAAALAWGHASAVVAAGSTSRAAALGSARSAAPPVPPSDEGGYGFLEHEWRCHTSGLPKQDPTGLDELVLSPLAARTLDATANASDVLVDKWALEVAPADVFALHPV